MSCSGLTRTSMDPRVALRLPEDDKEEKRMPEDDAFLSVIAGLIFLSVIAGLGPAIQRYKALAHDMHAESIALQQRFAPQPELRSSWQQFVIAGLIFLSVIAGLGPAIQRYKDIRHLLTICTQKASRSNKGSRRSRSYGQAGNSLSLPGLARQSNYDP